MTRDDAPRLKQILGAIHDLHRRALTRPTFLLWFEALKGYDMDVVSAALSRHLVNPDNGQFLPMPADVVKLIEGGSEDVALLAWAKVDRAMRTVGPWPSVVFDEALIHHAIANMGGWIALSQKREDEWAFVRNQFVTLYRGARMRSFTYPARLMGIAEAQNQASGQPVALPRFIGDLNRAIAVVRGGQPIEEETQALAVRELLPAIVEKRA